MGVHSSVSLTMAARDSSFTKLNWLYELNKIGRGVSQSAKVQLDEFVLGISSKSVTLCSVNENLVSSIFALKAKTKH